jgi:tetratricopeptide (TPR) repeat protein
MVDMKKWLVLILILFNTGFVMASKRWVAPIPRGMENADEWHTLLGELKNGKFYYGSLIAAQRILTYYTDLKSKELAYQTLIELIDLGYPYSLRLLFMPGDLEIAGKYPFDQSYNLYKATINLDKNMSKWANIYFSRVDKETFAKYIFYNAIEAINDKKIPEAEVLLKKALSQLKDPLDFSLAAKVARTLARLYYQVGQYAKALDIYQSYLLKLNPIQMTDWLEAAWALYKLDRYNESLGYLYNLGSRDAKSEELLEAFVIRGLIYRELCDTRGINELILAFEKDYGKVIEGIKLGEPLRVYPKLDLILTNEGAELHQHQRLIKELELELPRTKELEHFRMTRFLYESEIAHLRKLTTTKEDLAWQGAARQLVIMGESLKFLKFDVIREKFNPDKVFEKDDEDPKARVENISDNRFLLHWLQWKDFWRDERLTYRALLKNRCLK